MESDTGSIGRPPSRQLSASVTVSWNRSALTLRVRDSPRWDIWSAMSFVTSSVRVVGAASDKKSAASAVPDASQFDASVNEPFEMSSSSTAVNSGKLETCEAAEQQGDDEPKDEPIAVSIDEARHGLPLIPQR